MADTELVDMLGRLVEQLRIANLLTLADHPITQDIYGEDLRGEVVEQLVDFQLDDDGELDTIAATERVGEALGIPPRHHRA